MTSVLMRRRDTRDVCIQRKGHERMQQEATGSQGERPQQ
jgi:hypothetical protein